MKRLILMPALALSACTEFQAAFAPPVVDAPVEPPAPTLDPTPPPPPPPTARTVAEFDTTTAEDREAALAAPEPAGETALGTAIGALGNPADPGIWVETALVTELKPGRITWEGNSVNVELRPSGGQAGSGAEISLAAMRLLEAPLVGLHEIMIFAE
ncbi:D-galactarate dehydratase [Yoonia sp. R2331]|uniref:D-galactarate dehydratase n=1 Tax=Yoonia sp. R2331 TaxID=3237238 RepID=UPI0034E59A35